MLHIQDKRPNKGRKGTASQMKVYIFTILLSIFFVSGAVYAHKLMGFEDLPFSKTTIKKISSGDIFVSSKSTSFKEKQFSIQTLKYHTAGLHKRSCRKALRKISIYENHEQYLGFVEKSRYNPKTERIFLLLSSPILPIKMVMDFNIPRIKKPGVYSFYFDKGFLKGLIGKIHVSEHNSRCLFYMTADWKGPHTKFPNLVLEFFSSTLGKIGMSSLFRISEV